MKATKYKPHMMRATKATGSALSKSNPATPSRPRHLSLPCHSPLLSASTWVGDMRDLSVSSPLHQVLPNLKAWLGGSSQATPFWLPGHLHLRTCHTFFPLAFPSPTTHHSSLITHHFCLVQVATTTNLHLRATLTTYVPLTCCLGTSQLVEESSLQPPPCSL